MQFYEVLAQVIALLQRQGRVTYGALKLHFQLDDATLAVLKDELLYRQPRVVEADDKGLVWTGASPAAALGAPVVRSKRSESLFSPLRCCRWLTCPPACRLPRPTA